MGYREEVQRVVLTYLLDKYPPNTKLTNRHWEIAYKVLRANAIMETLTWKLNNLTVSL